MTAATLGYTPGAGANVATDQDAGGAHHQKALTEYLDPSGVATPASYSTPFPVHDEDAVLLLQRLLTMLTSPAGYDRSLQRGRVTAVVESGTVTTVTTVTAVTTVSTVTTVTGLSNIDGRNGGMLINQSNLSAWRDCVRSCIT